MPQQTYINHKPTYEAAFDFMAMKNRACERAGNKNDTFCVVPGPENNYSVVDLATAIDLGMGYVFSSRSASWVENPWK